MKAIVQRRARAGSALLAAVLVVGMVAVMSMAYLQLSLNKNREQKTAVDAKRSFYVAEAGLSEAMVSIASGTSGNVGSESLPARFGDGCFYVTATDEGSGKTTLMSVGMVGCGRSAVSTVVDVKKQGIAALGVFSDGTVTIGKKVLIDGYDSRQGSYAAQAPLLGAPTTARVGSNADVVVHGASQLSRPTSIYGNAHPGPMGSVLRDGNVVITGSTAPSEMLTVLPDIAVPTVASAGDATVSEQRPLTLSAGEFGYDTLKLNSKAHTDIVGPASLVVNGLELASQSQLTLDGRNGPIKIYVRNHLDLQGGSLIVSTSQDPTAVALLIGGGTNPDGTPAPDPTANFSASGSFFGTIYAPNTVVTLPSTLTIYGAISAKRLTLMDNAKVHFDLALIDSSAEDETVPQTIGWRIVPLPRTPLVDLHLDIMQLLKLQGIVPPLASTAHVPIGGTPPSSPLDRLNHLLNGHGNDDHSGDNGNSGPH